MENITRDGTLIRPGLQHGFTAVRWSSHGRPHAPESLQKAT